MLSDETRKAILILQSQYPEKRSALIPALHLAQEEVGYLPFEVQSEVAALFEIDQNEVRAVVTFYDMFHEKPLGKHLLHVCKNVSCMLRAGDQLLTSICHKLNIQPGQTSTDGAFTVIPSECLGACDRAPMMLVDEKVVGPIYEQDLDQILAEAKNGSGHPSPVDKRELING